MIKKFRCRSCDYLDKTGELEKCPSCGDSDWKKVYKPREPKPDAVKAAPKKAAKPAKKPAAKKTTKPRGRKPAVDPILEKRFAVLARAVDDTAPHEPNDAFIAWSEGGPAGFSVKPPTVNDTDYLIPLALLNEVIYNWLVDHPGEWAFEVIEPALARSLAAVSFTQSVLNGEPVIAGDTIRDAEKLSPRDANLFGSVINVEDAVVVEDRDFDCAEDVDATFPD